MYEAHTHKENLGKYNHPLSPKYNVNRKVPGHYFSRG